MAQRSREQIAKDRAEIARLMLRGHSQEMIAAELGISQPTVSREVKKIRQAWLESSLIDFNEVKARELAKIDQLEAYYWKCIERDEQPFKSKTARIKSISIPDTSLERLILTETGIRPKKDARKIIPIERDMQEVTREHNVNPAYLAGIERCIMMRAKIYGFDKATPAPEMPDLQAFFDALTGTLPEIWEEEEEGPEEDEEDE